MARGVARAPLPNAGPLPSGRLPAWVWLLPAIVAAALYGPTLAGTWVWDDSIVLGTQLAAIRGWGEAFFPPPGIPQWPYAYYRPLLTVSYLLDRAVFGELATRGPHAVNVLLHALSTLLVAWLALRLFAGRAHARWAALGAGLLFAVHPIHTESVSWITGRSDVLATCLLLAALALAARLRSGAGPGAIAGSLLLFALATLSKEVALVGVGLLPILLWALPAPEPERPRCSSQRERWLIGGYALVALGYGLLRAAAGTESGLGRFEGGVAAAAGRLLAALGYYLLKVVWPPPQSALVVELPAAGWGALVGSLAIAFLVWAGLRARQGQRQWLLGGLWVLVPLLPALPVAISRLAEAPVAERYLYLPSVGVSWLFAGALTLALERLGRRELVLVAAAALVTLAGAATVTRNQVWRSDLALWSDTVRKAPDSGLAWNELGKAYLDRRLDLDTAKSHFERALATYDDPFGRALASNSLGVIAIQQGRANDAIEAWTRAAAEKPDYATPHFNLGNFYASRVDAQLRAGRGLDRELLAQARAHLARAVEADPRYTKAVQRLRWCDEQASLHAPLTRTAP
jgi:protein O-mannosyl-transferase